jgi:hypothetical protein
MASTNEPGGPKPMDHDPHGIHNWNDDPLHHIKKPPPRDPKDIEAEAKRALEKYNDKTKR